MKAFAAGAAKTAGKRRSEGSLLMARKWWTPPPSPWKLTRAAPAPCGRFGRPRRHRARSPKTGRHDNHQTRLSGRARDLAPAGIAVPSRHHRRPGHRSGASTLQE
jgi:hypothetical protein